MDDRYIINAFGWISRILINDCVNSLIKVLSVSKIGERLTKTILNEFKGLGLINGHSMICPEGDPLFKSIF